MMDVMFSEIDLVDWLERQPAQPSGGKQSRTSRGAIPNRRPKPCGLPKRTLASGPSKARSKP